MKFPSLFKPPEAASSWPWPVCGNPKTLSFRANYNGIFKTINNSAYLEQQEEDIITQNLSLTKSTSETETEESVEMVISRLRSGERLLFEPGAETSSILEEAKSTTSDDGFLPFKESVTMAMDSNDPFVDFKRSMEEMVEAYGLKDWECLERLLTSYLKVNAKSNHGYIVGAFVDLLAGLGISFSLSSSSSSHDYPNSSSTTAHSFTSRLSFSSSTVSSISPCLSSLEPEDEVQKTVVESEASSTHV